MPGSPRAGYPSTATSKTVACGREAATSIRGSTTRARRLTAQVAFAEQTRQSRSWTSGGFRTGQRACSPIGARATRLTDTERRLADGETFGRPIEFLPRFSRLRNQVTASRCGPSPGRALFRASTTSRTTTGGDHKTRSLNVRDFTLTLR